MRMRERPRGVHREIALVDEAVDDAHVARALGERDPPNRQEREQHGARERDAPPEPRRTGERRGEHERAEDVRGARRARGLGPDEERERYEDEEQQNANGSAHARSYAAMLLDVPRRVSLPVTSDPRLSLARARERLGGRVSSHGRAGEMALFDASPAVVVWSDAAECDLWIGEDRIRRVPADAATPGQPSSPLAPVADDARAFARLEEGQAVIFDGATPGRLIEKCRWGGLVAIADGRIFAVGFRRFARARAN